MDTVLLDLANPEQALGLYLDALLREVPLTPAAVPANRALTTPSTSTTIARVTTPVPVAVTTVTAVPVSVRARDLELCPEPEVTTRVTAPIPPTPTPTPTPISVPTPTPIPTPTPTTTPTPVRIVPAVVLIPKEPFQALLFQVAGLTVAVPLVELNGILVYPERLAAVPGLPSWGMGMLRHRDKNLIVVDSINLFVPENHQDESRSRAHPRYLVILGGGRFGLACDSVNQVVTLKPEEVRWRGERGRRPWLAGTVKERLCALLEVPSLVRLLEAGRLEEQDVTPIPTPLPKGEVKKSDGQKVKPPGFYKN